MNNETKNPINTGRSTIGDIAEHGYGYTDVKNAGDGGNLLNPDKTPYTHNVTGTLNENYANGQELVDDAAAKNHTHEIGVVMFATNTEQTVQQGSKPTTLFQELETGRLQYVSGPRTSEPTQQPAQTPQVAAGTITASIAFDAPGNRKIIAGDKLDITLNVPAGQSWRIRAADDAQAGGKPVPVYMHYRIGTGERMDAGTDLTTPPISEATTVYIDRQMPEGVASSGLIVDVQEAR